jgi:hypothetical protein
LTQGITSPGPIPLNGGWATLSIVMERESVGDGMFSTEQLYAINCSVEKFGDLD